MAVRKRHESIIDLLLAEGADTISASPIRASCDVMEAETGNALHRLMVLGLFFVALGVVGAFVPIIPTVAPLLAAIFFFSRSHPEWAERLYAHPKYGPALRKWRDHKAIGRKAKWSAVAAMGLSAAITCLTVGWPWAAAVSAILVCIAAWIWTRPE